MISLTGKKALVTGSSRGIGAAIALKLAEAGADVVVNYASNQEGAERVKEKIQGLGSNAVAVQADVADSGEAEDLITTTLDFHGRIDILVNNAGITRDKLLLRMKEDEWDQVLAVNLKGVYNCTRAAARSMLKNSAGRIINISSVVGRTGNAGQANYAASKAGIIGFSKSIAREFSSRGITVNVVAPGFIKTDMTDRIPEEKQKEMLNNIPLNRFGEREDIANLILFLASDLSSYITGQVINVDGGMLM